jgi:hypothetical protein
MPNGARGLWGPGGNPVRLRRRQESRTQRSNSNGYTYHPPLEEREDELQTIRGFLPFSTPQTSEMDGFLCNWLQPKELEDRLDALATLEMSMRGLKRRAADQALQWGPVGPELRTAEQNAVIS